MEAVAFRETPVDERVLRSVVDPHARVEVRAVDIAFGGQKVLNGVSIDLRSGELALLRGENGSGKTVLLNVLAGYLAPDRGSVRLQLGGEWIDTTRWSPESLARRGVGRLWQDIRLFPSMTVIDNVLAGTPQMLGDHPVFALLARPAVLRQERAARDRALHNLALMGMADRPKSSCDMLSVGQMKRVALARLLQMEASLLLLDEPFGGLDATAVTALARDLDCLRREHGKTILVVEHRHDVVSRIADHVWTMVDGRIADREERRV
jgi:branched-chain amino acid transport system ATP-binding protein